MIVNDKYRLGALVRSGDVATFEAQEISTGRGFYVHLMAGAATAASLAAQVRARLAAGSRASSPDLIEQGDYEGAPFVVTAATPELVDLKRWIEAQPAPGSTVAESSGTRPGGPPGASQPAREPGEFTRLFQGGGGQDSAPRPPTAPGSPRPEAPATAPGTGAGFDSGSAPSHAALPRAEAPQVHGQEPGEFTRMFSSGDPESRPAAPLAPSSPPPGHAKTPPDTAPPTSPAASGSTEGEFTRLFREKQAGQLGAGSGPPAAPPAAPPATVPPTLRQELAPEPPAAVRTPVRPQEIVASGPDQPASQPAQTPSGPGQAPSGPAESGPTRAPSEAYEGPSTWQTGEFAKLFGPGPPPSEAEGPASSAGVAQSGVSDSGLRRMSPEERRQEMRQFRMVSRPGDSGRTGPETESPPAAPPELPPPVAPPAAGPKSSREAGEFTRLFQSPPAGAPGLPPVPPPSPLAPAPAPPAGAPDRRSATQLGGPGATPAGGPLPAPEQPGDVARLAQQEPWPKPSPRSEPPAPPPTFAPPYERPAAPSARGAEPPKVEQTGEFTKLFRQGKPPSGRPEPAPPAPPAPRPGSPGSGEFTRLFGSGGRSAPPQADPWSERPHSPPPPRASEPGAFTRIFGGGGSPAAPGGDPFSGGSGGSPWQPSPQQPAAEPENQGGDFTKMFGGKPGQGPGGSADWSDKRHEPGGATQISREPAPPPAAQPSAPVQGPSDYTRMMGNAPPAPRQQSQLPQQPQPYQPVPPPAPPPAYTAAPPAYAAPAPPPPAAAPPVAAQPPPQPARHQPERDPGTSERSMYLILALLFCALLVVALGIVLFVSLTGERGEQAGPAPQTGQEAPQAPAASQGSGVNPSLAVPGVRPPSVTSPSLRPPSLTAPSLSGSGISGGSVAAPSVSAPSVSAPSISAPSVSGTSVSGPRMPTLPSASSGQIPASAAAPLPSGQPAAAESSGTPFFALIIMLSILLVMAVGAAVYFAVRRA